ncbi:MAG: flagellin FliC, partial [Proteobacteria bacterium]
DVAKETAEMASANILQQAATSVLAQANAQPNQALRLIA